ncbi:MAG: protein translocase subunit SecD, partial [Candidatus Pacebacteria bacterium]|nr:protein translocase subunit SecD [Candidatus Paceibacterota bacterium]
MYMIKKRLQALLVLIIGLSLGFFVYKSEPVGGHVPTTPNILTSYFEKNPSPFKLGLDLSGGTHLVYEADVSDLDSSEVSGSMQVLRDLVEHRINSRQVSGVLGVLEPLVQVKEGGIGGSEQLIVDLPGVTDVSQAIDTIGATPTLEFRIESGKEVKPVEATVGKDGTVSLGSIDPYSNFVSTGLTGRYLDKAILEFDPNTGVPRVSLNFNEEGAKMFAAITKANIGKVVGIFLDGKPISTPVVQEEITGGQAVISGNFTPKEGKALADSLRYGALPVPIKLVSSELIGPSLGASAIQAGIMAGIIGFLAIAIFLLFWYRLPGLVAVISLGVYVAIMLTIFKFLNVTLSSAAIGGFIISIGIAVDANVLIFERIKEELRGGRTISDAINTGFSRAWLSIRDSNISSIITALILYFIFDVSFVRGFAITFLLGILTSMVSAILVSRLFLRAIAPSGETKFTAFLFGSGF